MRFLIGLILLCAATWSAPVLADPATPPPLEAYGALPSVEAMALSPSGEKTAFVGTVHGKRSILVFDANQQLILTRGLGELKFRSLDWVGNDHLAIIYSATVTLGQFFTKNRTELFAVIVMSMDGDIEQVFNKVRTVPEAAFGYHGVRERDGEWYLYVGGLTTESVAKGTMQRMGSEAELYEIRARDMKTRRIARRYDGDAYRDWIVDADGNSAAVTLTFHRTTGRWSIANADNDKVAEGVDPLGRIDLIALSHDGSKIIYEMESEDGASIQYMIVPVGGGAPEEFLPEVSVRRWYIDPHSGRLLGYLPEGEDEKAVFFDPGQEDTIRAAFRAFPNLNVRIEGWSEDFGQLLLSTNGNGDSGTWWRVDMATKSAVDIGYERPAIYARMVGPISRFDYKARDGLDISGILTLPPGREAKGLPLVMLPHGGPNSHDEEQFDWWAQAFASRGYAVLQPNFRGSTNRDLAFMQAGYGEWGGKMLTDIKDGLTALAAKGIVDPKRACIMGGSYGGYAALASVTLFYGNYRCAVSVNGVSDVQELYQTDMRWSGRNRMTRNYYDATVGERSLLKEISPRKIAERADAPILLIHGRDDTRVPFRQSKEMAEALTRAGRPNQLIELDGEDHWLSNSVTRQAMLTAAMDFIQKHNPAD